MKRILYLLIPIFLFCCKEDPKIYILTITSNTPEGGVISSSGGEYEEGSIVTITATPKTYYEFEGWTGDWVGNENPLTIIMDNDKNIAGSFRLSDIDGDGVTDEFDLDNETRPDAPVDENGVMLNPVYLDTNGVTVKCFDWSIAGDIGEVNGVEYKVVSEEELRNTINNFGDVTNFCTSRVTNMSFLMNSKFNQDISSWDVSNVTQMDAMFLYSQFNQDISLWDVSSVTNMVAMFQEARYFNQPIGSWDVSNVIRMDAMFRNSEFNQDISDWDVGNVTNMQNMFYNSIFNQPINSWDVSSVTNMIGMFNYSQFDQDISTWEVSSVINMDFMFLNSQFNQDLSLWVVHQVVGCTDFSLNTPQWILPKPNFTNCTE